MRTPEVVITRADWEAELARIPVEHRTAFATSPQRVQAAINNLLVNRTLAERARAKGVDKDPATARRYALEIDRLLAGLMIERIEAEAGAEFDRDSDRNLARARELYLVNQSKYAVAEQIDVSHILFDTTKRGKDTALSAANEARAKILAGADFNALATEISDDPSAATNKGRLNGVTRGKTDPAFERSAFGLRSPGDVSEPVLSKFGYHLIKLEDRKPGRSRTFAEAQRTILNEMRQKYVNETRDAAVREVRSDKRMQFDQEALDGLVVTVEVPPLPKAAAPAKRAN